MRAGRKREVRYIHANEEPISRENKREDALIRLPGGSKVLRGTGLIKTDSAGSFKNVSDLAEALGKAALAPQGLG